MSGVRHFFQVAALLAILIAAAGCKREDPAPAIDVDGVKVDVVKLEAAFDKAPPENQKLSRQVQLDLRYATPLQALKTLDQLINAPGLNDEQKKMVNLCIEQTKAVIQKNQGAAPK
jgi:hypothetical protein